MAMLEENPRLPPSPPPSPPRQRKHRKKKSDPFFELAATPVASPSAPSSPAADLDEPQESLVTRIIISPILFTSFLFSLFLINRRDRVRRTNSHATSTSSASLLSYFSLTSNLWVDPEPYQDPDSSAWSRGRASEPSHVEPHSVLSNASNNANLRDSEGKTQTKKRESWHLHKKIRKVAKLEISDALEMRGRVIAGLVCVIGLLVAVVFWGLMWCVRRWL